MNTAQIFRVRIDKGHEGLWYGQAQDHQGLLVTGNNTEEVIGKIPTAIWCLFQAKDIDVCVIKAEALSTDEHIWVAIEKGHLKALVASKAPVYALNTTKESVEKPITTAEEMARLYGKKE